LTDLKVFLHPVIIIKYVTESSNSDIVSKVEIEQVIFLGVRASFHLEKKT